MRLARPVRWVATALGVALAAWVVPNLGDEAPTPVPTELRLADAPPATPAAQAWIDLANTPDLPRLQGPPLVCADGGDCTPQWRADIDALAAQLEPAAAFEARCTTLLRSGPFVELLPADLAQGPLTPHTMAVLRCGTVWAARAVGAAARGETDAALEALARGDALARRVLDGSQSLVGHAMAWAQLRRQWQAVAAVALLQPAQAVSLMPLAEPLAPGALDASRWMRVEAALARQQLATHLERCEEAGAPVFTLACHLRLAWLPQATLAESDRRWLRRWTAARGEPAQALPALLAVEAEEEARARHVPWRNPLGHGLLDGQARPLLSPYVARAADVELQRQTLSVGLQLLGVPASERPAWLQQHLPAGLKDRLSLTADGQVLQARRWSTGLPGDGPRWRIDFRLPDSPRT